MIEVEVGPPKREEDGTILQVTGAIIAITAKIHGKATLQGSLVMMKNDDES